MDLLVKMAIRAGAVDLVRFHLRRDQRVDRQDDSGNSLLMYAAGRGQAEICQILLDAGADPALKNHQGQDALSLARATGHDAVQAVLLAAIPASVREPGNEAADSQVAVADVADGQAVMAKNLSGDTVDTAFIAAQAEFDLKTRPICFRAWRNLMPWLGKRRSKPRRRKVIPTALTVLARFI